MSALRLDQTTLLAAARQLGERDPLIRRIVSELGPPPLWLRRPGFASLLLAILEQQVSLASAAAVYRRLLETVGTLTPESFLRLDALVLRRLGFSRQKASYCTTIARMIVDGELDLDALEGAGDDTIRSTLTSLKGIGRWTADVYLLHSLGRPDIWPTGDLALKIAVQEAMQLDAQPDESELESLGEAYRPWRSVAALVFWHAYLTRRGFTGTPL